MSHDSIIHCKWHYNGLYSLCYVFHHQQVPDLCEVSLIVWVIQAQVCHYCNVRVSNNIPSILLGMFGQGPIEMGPGPPRCPLRVPVNIEGQ